MSINQETILFLAALALTGCAANVTPQATGGSRSDGVVVLSYQVGVFWKAVIDYDAALNTATEKCQNWGFERAEPFGGANRTCVSEYDSDDDGDSACMSHRTDISYQCVGENP